MDIKPRLYIYYFLACLILSSCGIFIGNLNEKDIVEYRLNDFNNNKKHYYIIKDYLYDLHTEFGGDTIYKLTTSPKAKGVWMEKEISFIDGDSVVHYTYIKHEPAYYAPDSITSIIKMLSIGGISFNKENFRISFSRDISRHYIDYLLLKKPDNIFFTENDDLYFNQYNMPNPKIWLYKVNDDWAIQGTITSF